MFSFDPMSNELAKNPEYAYSQMLIVAVIACVIVLMTATHAYVTASKKVETAVTALILQMVLAGCVLYMVGEALSK